MKYIASHTAYIIEVKESPEMPRIRYGIFTSKIEAEAFARARSTYYEVNVRPLTILAKTPY